MDEEVYSTLIETVMERIEYLENNDPDNSIIDELKLLLSDNVSKDGEIQIRFSLLNKKAYYLFLELYELSSPVRERTLM